MTDLDAWSGSVPAERAEWLSALQDWSDAPPAAFPSYLELLAPAGAELVLLHRRTASRTTVMPLALRRIPDGDGLLDAVGPYGYGSAFSTTGGADPAFWAAAAEWARDRGLVSVVARLPVAGSVHVEWPFDRHEVGHNVVRSVVGWDDYWQDVDRKVRKNVRRATTAELHVEQVPARDGLDDFMRLYLGTMSRREASDSFRLDHDSVGLLLEELGPRATLFFAAQGGRRVSTEIVLREAGTLYSFLGGTDEADFELRPNDLLKCEIVRWAHDEGLQQFVLGGGIGGAEDGIFRYKRAFAPSGVVPFAIGEWVLDRAAYDDLVARVGGAPSTGWPRYRAR